MTYDRRSIRKYLAWTFSLAWILQVLCAVSYQKGDPSAGQALLAASMFAPLLGFRLSGHSLKELDWKFHFKKNIRTLLEAWFLPAVFTACGALLYFAVFPDQFSLQGEYMEMTGNAAALDQLEAQGISYAQYILLTSLSCITYAPAVNMLFAVGEEAGWRGYLYPQLQARYGKKKGMVYGGIVWGIWHWPVIWLIGYEYGSTYFGYPFTGMLLFCLITIALGTLCSRVYEKSGSIWYPAIFHGAFNAAATVPLAVCNTLSGNTRLLGPSPVGILSALPMILAALWILHRES